MRLQPVGHAGCFQRGHERAVGVKTLVAQCRDQRVDGAGVGGGEIRPVEADQRERPSIRGRQCRQHAPCWIIEAPIGDIDLSDDGFRMETRGQCQLGDRRLRRRRAAVVAETLQAPQGRDRQVRERIEARIVAPVGRQHGECDAALLRELMQRGETIGPVGFAADQAHQHAARLRQRPLDIGVDRERMTKRREVGEPERRKAATAASPAGRKRGEIAVGERENHEVGRILTEIDGCRGLLQPMTLAKDNVHRITNPKAKSQMLRDRALS